jgi:hypothetical protein
MPTVLEARLYALFGVAARLCLKSSTRRGHMPMSYLAYSQALADHAHALVTLEPAPAIWDVSLYVRAIKDPVKGPLRSIEI